MSTQLDNAPIKQTNELVLSSVSFTPEQPLIQWLETQAKAQGLSYLLAHAVDGIIWGRFDDEGKLTTADEIGFSGVDLPSLRLETLQQCWVFGDAGEVFLWSCNGEWRSRHISHAWETPYMEADDYIEEAQLLWGDHAEQQKGFSLLRDGSQGLKHAIPTVEGLSFDPQKSNKLQRSARLTVRHYINYGADDGVARIFLSRLVGCNTQK